MVFKVFGRPVHRVPDAGRSVDSRAHCPSGVVSSSFLLPSQGVWKTMSSLLNGISMPFCSKSSKILVLSAISAYRREDEQHQYLEVLIIYQSGKHGDNLFYNPKRFILL